MNERMKMEERCKFSRWKWDYATEHLRRADLCRKLLHHHLQSRMTWAILGEQRGRKITEVQTADLLLEPKPEEDGIQSSPHSTARFRFQLCHSLGMWYWTKCLPALQLSSLWKMMGRFCPRVVKMVKQNTCELLTVHPMWWNCVVNDWFLFTLPNSNCFSHPK